MFNGLGAPELIIILVIVLLLFGAKRLPEMARSLGKSSKEFKKGMEDGADDEPTEPKPDPK
jgi:sec-independent protein translocase protein TatA